MGGINKCCFNTASVLIQLIEGTEDLGWIKFQYSFCSYSTFPATMIIYKSSFNTASVLIQPYCLVNDQRFQLFQYSFCSYSTIWDYYEKKGCKSFNTASVLIQLKMAMYSKDGLRFNTASVLIQQYLTPYIGLCKMFQYSFCSYSTYKRSIHWYSIDWVSIQLLFLFNFTLICFAVVTLMFQYSFCSYSTGSANPEVKECWFQYSFCSYSTKKLQVGGRSCEVSIQLLFLFNLVYDFFFKW